MAETTKTPWSEDVLNNLQKRQAAEHLHAYTCVVHSNISLIPTVDGWNCSEEGCDYTQDWALTSDAEGDIPDAVTLADFLGGAEEE